MKAATNYREEASANSAAIPAAINCKFFIFTRVGGSWLCTGTWFFRQMKSKSLLLLREEGERREEEEEEGGCSKGK
jgi:hypothetical protein